MIPLRLYIFIFATIPGLLAKPNESYTKTDEKLGEKGINNLTSDMLEQLRVSLSLDNMMLKYLPHGFVQSQFLTHLSLEGNQIDSISISALEFVPQLLHLSLANNALQNIDLHQFSMVQRLKTLNLNGNCRMKLKPMTEVPSSRRRMGLFDFFGENRTEYGEPEIDPQFDKNVTEYGEPEIDPQFDENGTEYGEPVVDPQFVEPPRVTLRPCEVDLSARLPSLTKLYLENNNLEQLTFSEGSTLPMLTHLYLSDNRLKIHSEMLSNLNKFAPSLSDLHLNNSEIDQFDASQLPAVTSLYLDKNRIRSVCNEYCEPLSLKLAAARNLKTLSVAWNEIVKLEPDSFNYTTNLVTLDLSHNKIFEIREGTFEKLHLLRSLRLEFNHLVELNGIDTFRGFINLEYLSLGHNGIRNITARAFETLVALKTLALNDNQIQSIDSGIFSKLASLEKLSLAGNRLSRIPDGCMPISGSLITLNLSNNQFTSTKHIYLTNTPNLQFLSLEDNPLAIMTLHWHSGTSENLTITLGNTRPDKYITELPIPNLWFQSE